MAETSEPKKRLMMVEKQARKGPILPTDQRTWSVLRSTR